MPLLPVKNLRKDNFAEKILQMNLIEAKSGEKAQGICTASSSWPFRTSYT